ncbi:120_t:CDS:2, partial [Ambispora leptoticha]
VSDGGVHSHINHLYHLLESAKNYGIPKAYVHFFGDGRDTNPRSSDKYLEQLQNYINEINYGEVATIVGRYYAMDRDKRWERIKVAFDALTLGAGEKSLNPSSIIEERFKKDETDEFLKPIIISDEGRIRDGDTLFFFNYRADRMREIVQAFGISPPPFEADNITCMTRYKSEFPFPVAFPPQTMDNVLAEWLAKNKIPQCHCAETEKYAHVTFFFNGGVEKQFDLEHRELIPSPKVATYDLKPEMSAAEITDKMIEQISSGKFPFVMCNFANPDMVGHTGVYEATVKAVAVTDECIGRIYEACEAHGYTLFITADHGNAEQMKDDKGNPHTAHTCNPVPFIMTSKTYKFVDNADGALCSVAPTILDALGLEIPKEMD